MSKYTTEVRYICENANGLDNSVGFLDVDQIIEGAIPSVFSFSFPVFDEAYRNVLCTKILRHYYTREIGFETVGLWKLKLQTKLNEIMPYFNQLYETQLIKFNPLYDTDMTTTNVGDKTSETNKEQSNTGITTGNGSYSDRNEVIEANKTASESASDSSAIRIANDDNKATKYDLYSDTPQGALTGVDAENYLTNARKTTDNAEHTANEAASDNVKNSLTEQNDKTAVSNLTHENSENRSSIENMSGTDKFNSTESYLIHVVGKQSGTSFSKMIQEFRETFLNIDMEVIESLADLFCNLW